MSITKSLFLSTILAVCLLAAGGFANAEDDADGNADVDVGCRTSESLTAFQDATEPGIRAGADVSDVYENTLLIDDVLAHLCVVADDDAFTVGKDLGGGFSEATLINGAQVEHLIMATPMMDDVDFELAASVQLEAVTTDEPAVASVMPIAASMAGGPTVTEVSEKTDLPLGVWENIRPGILAGTFRKLDNTLYMEPQ